MPESTLHILANCSDRKRVVPDADLRLRAYGQRPFNERFVAWAKALTKRRAPELPARDLYVGPHWAAVRELETHAHARGFRRVRLWVLSAGYGLLEADDSVAGYSSTFSTGEADSVVLPNDGDRPSLLQEWWRLLSTRSPARRRPQTIAALARADRAANFLVIASPTYVDAIASDLSAAVSSTADADRVVIVTSKMRHPKLIRNWLRSSEALLSRVGGARTSLHARVANDLISSLKAPLLSASAAQTRYARIERNAPPVTHFDRAPKSDRDVTSFIRQELRRDRGATHTRLLREFRAQGMACEQKRFRALFRTVQA